jgi:hypothetical protein
MTWQAPPRPEWVQAVNRGDVLPITEVAARPLTPDALLDEARAGLGLDRSAGVGTIDGDDGFVEPLAVACRALEDEAELHVLGRWATRRYLVRLLQVRFQLAALLEVDPGVRDEEVRAPVVVTGAPRTGTTILYGLLSRDAAFRVPEGWELLRPVPPPDPGRFPDPGRLALAEEELRQMATTVSSLDAIHVYSARMPKECISAMSFSLLTEELTARYHVPSYVEALMAADMRPAYEVHRLVLQVLQRRFGPVQWVLKSPVHLRSLPDLLAVYPDARVVVTHRDPLTVLPSVSSLVATLRWAHSDHVELSEIGAYHERLYHDALDGLVDVDEAGLLDPARTHHGRYADFVDDPLGSVRRTYEALGLVLGPATEEAMAAHLAASPKGATGEHRYAFDDLGLDREVERRRFARYCDRYSVPVEA